MPTDESMGEMRTLIRDLANRIESQQAELAALRAELKPGLCAVAEKETTRSTQKMSRAGLLKMAGLGAAAATAVGLDMTTAGSSALAADTNPVSAGRVTNAEHGTTVTYDGAAGFTGAVLLGNDSTNIGNGDFSYPAAVAGIAGGGATAGAGGLVNGMYGYTEHGAGTGVVGYNTNRVPGTGNGVLGVAFAGTSSGVHGTNTAGTAVRGESTSGIGVWGSSEEYFGVLGQAHNSANFSAGVAGSHDGATGGVGVFGKQTGDGVGGYFTSASGIGVNASGKIAVQAIGSEDPDSVGVITSGKAVGVQASAGSTGVVATGNVIGLTASGADKFGVSASGPTAVVAEGADIGVHGITNSTGAKAWGVIGEVTSTSPNGLSAGVFGVNDSTNGNGMGVLGKHAGSGQGGHFQSLQGIGAACDGGTGRGGTFKGSSAALRLVPGSASTHPVSGLAGDLFVDSSNRLWFCQQGGKRATWKQIG